MEFRIDNSEANFRSGPNTTNPPLARLAAGHLVVGTGNPIGQWQPCTTDVDGRHLTGFVNVTLLRRPINPEVDRLVAVAGEEFKQFLFGTRPETHPDSGKRIEKYWKSFQSTSHPPSTAWSAATISFMVKTANLTKSFKFSGRHTVYFSDSKRAFLAGDATRAYWAVRLDHAPLAIGDLVGYSRIDPPGRPGTCGSVHHDYDDLPGDFCSHSDIVVAIRGGKAITIGGNVKQTVRVTEVPLLPSGHVKPGSSRILVMKRNF